MAVYGCVWLYMAVYGCKWLYMAVSYFGARTTGTQIAFALAPGLRVPKLLWRPDYGYPNPGWCGLLCAVDDGGFKGRWGCKGWAGLGFKGMTADLKGGGVANCMAVYGPVCLYRALYVHAAPRGPVSARS